MTYICENTSKMNILYLVLILPFPLLNGLFNNKSTCLCTCQNPYLGEPGDNHTYKPNSPVSLMDPYVVSIYK